MKASLSRRVAAEAVGTAMLLAAVVGSGIMGERLSGGNVAIALLANAMSIALHSSGGFRTVGTRERIACLNGRWRDTVLMERRSKTVGAD